jgi:GNAT superfamily N-acetyltransferase
VAIEVKAVSGMEQLERWVAVQNEVRPDDPESTSMKALIRAQEPGHLDLLAYVEGEPAGAGMLADDPESRRSAHPWVAVNVPGRHRSQGVGTALLGALVRPRARSRCDRTALPGSGSDVYSRSFLDRRGFVEYGRFERCSLDLDSRELSAAALPEGIELAWLDDRPDVLDAMHGVALATYPELGGHRARQAESFLDWQVYELGSPNTLLDAVPVALADGRVVGFATMRKHLDATTGELRTVLVLPEWRRRGIASALLGAQLSRARDRGICRVTVWVRHTQPLDLFLSLGFRVEDGSILLHGPLL